MAASCHAVAALRLPVVLKPSSHRNPSLKRSSEPPCCQGLGIRQLVPAAPGHARRSMPAARQLAAAAAPAATAATAPTDLRDVIESLLSRRDMSECEAEGAMEALLNGADAAQIAAFLVLLRAKGESPAEIAGLARAMRGRSVEVRAGADTVDIVGTGGDGANTVNISTGACILAAAAGAHVAKHGNRSVSSACGSADVLEALGVEVELGPKAVARCVREVGVGFMYAPLYHPAMRVVAPVRKSLRVRTAFNLLGPLLNPSQAPFALVGVFNASMVELMAEALQRLGLQRAVVVHSKGLDEISPMGPADMLDVTPHGIYKFRVDPLDHGIPRCTIDDLRGGDAALNAKLLRAAFAGEPGPIANALILNAGVALAACGMVDNVGDGISRAKEAHARGLALNVCDQWAQLSQELSKEEQLAAA